MFDSDDRFHIVKQVSLPETGDATKIGSKISDTPNNFSGAFDTAAIAVRDPKAMIVTYEEVRPFFDEFDMSEDDKMLAFKSLVLLASILTDKGFRLLPEQQIADFIEHDSSRRRGNHVFSEGYPKRQFNKAAEDDFGGGKVDS